jgi:hypothetical protein
MRSAIVYVGVRSASAMIATIVASEAARYGPVSVGELGQMPLSRLENIELLVVGGPIHVRMGRARETGVVLEEREVGEDTERLADWLEQLSPRIVFPAAAFDTRHPQLRVMTRSAARGIYRALRRHQCHLLTKPVTFLVAPDSSRLLEGRQERATTWARSVVRTAEHHRLAGMGSHGGSWLRSTVTSTGNSDGRLSDTSPLTSKAPTE